MRKGWTSNPTQNKNATIDSLELLSSEFNCILIKKLISETLMKPEAILGGKLENFEPNRKGFFELSDLLLCQLIESNNDQIKKKVSKFTWSAIWKPV